MTIKIKQFVTYQTGAPAAVEGYRKDGSPIVRHSVISRGAGCIVSETPETETRLISEGMAEPARLSGSLAALAEEVLSVTSPLDAALAALAVRGIRVWHAVERNGYWRPADPSLGPARGGFSGCFREVAEVSSHWTADPDAVPLFSFATEHGFRRAYIWRAGGLCEIATEIHKIGR